MLQLPDFARCLSDVFVGLCAWPPSASGELDMIPFPFIGSSIPEGHQGQSVEVRSRQDKTRRLLFCQDRLGTNKQTKRNTQGRALSTNGVLLSPTCAHQGMSHGSVIAKLKHGAQKHTRELVLSCLVLSCLVLAWLGLAVRLFILV